MAKISRYELGRTGYPPEEVAKLLDHYKVQEPRRGRLLALAEDANRRGWWEEYGDSIPAEYQEHVGLEAEAESVVGWSTGVPGLLQTEAYARELNGLYRSAITIAPGILDRRVSIRMSRQQVLTKRDPPLRLSVVIDESALLRPIGGAEVMRAQLRHLAAMGDLPNVRLQVLPLASGISPPPGPFQVFGFSEEGQDAGLGDVVSVEGLTTNLLVEGETDIHIYRLLFDRLVEVSLSVEESQQLILQIAERS